MNVRMIALSLVFLLSAVTGVSAQEASPAAAKFCPVCGPHEEVEELTISYKHEGKKYSFCSLDCLKEFKKNPKKYVE